MSSTPGMKNQVEALFTTTREQIRSSVEKAERFVEVSKSYLAQLDQIENASDSKPPLRGDAFKGMDPFPAIQSYLNREERPRTRGQIESALVAGGFTVAGNKRTDKVIQTAIGSNVVAKKLKEPRYKATTRPDRDSPVGLPDWPDEWFTQ